MGGSGWGARQERAYSTRQDPGRSSLQHVATSSQLLPPPYPSYLVPLGWHLPWLLPHCHPEAAALVLGGLMGWRRGGCGGWVGVHVLGVVR